MPEKVRTETPHIDDVRGAGAITDHARVADLMTVEYDPLEKRNIFTLGEAAKRNNMAVPGDHSLACDRARQMADPYSAYRVNGTNGWNYEG